MLHDQSDHRIEMWGGVEATVNRVGDTFFDQLQKTGHEKRIDDLALIASLGIKKLRYPVLWERHAPEDIKEINLIWADERLKQIQELALEPIVGLIHHGSGPKYTHLLDPKFPILLAEYAQRVAERYPWISYYTPVNEPLTTARFSCLYGIWYPHKTDGLSFCRALLHECKGVVLAMQAIRSINPQAKLVQTEDIGKIYYTKPIAYQGEFENHRRWLTFDILMGRFDKDHPLWKYFIWCGVTEEELEWFLENPMPPDILGVNYYITSERFLDHEYWNYPESVWGTNGKDKYADVEAVRVSKNGIAGALNILNETWNRYNHPLAITEAHLGCTREEQMRWLKEVWDASTYLQTKGVAIRAVTAWSLFGAYNWHKLVSVDEDYYEPGVFDLRGKTPRPTRIAKLIKELATHGDADHPLLTSEGWWRRPERYRYTLVEHADELGHLSLALKSSEKRPLAIIGATGTLGKAFARICEIRGIEYVLLSRKEIDITHLESVRNAIDSLNPWAIINAAGYVKVDQAESEPEICRLINTKGPSIIATICKQKHIQFVTFSSDLVFDGLKNAPYVETDIPNPLNIYGKSKADAEKLVLEQFPESLVIRTSAFFGPWDSYNFAFTVLSHLVEKKEILVDNESIISPTYVPDLVHATLDLLIDEAKGMWHLSNNTPVSWYEFAHAIANNARLNSSLIIGKKHAELGYSAKRPVYSSLTSEKATIMPKLENSLTEFIESITNKEQFKKLKKSSASLANQQLPLRIPKQLEEVET